jgi:DNA mismatch repair protein MutL
MEENHLSEFLITVCGMGHDDALLAIERFATSKIYNDHDLFNISTLGFRGEAIPSIASVSRFTLITRDNLSDSGISIKIDGGKLIKVSETGAPTGTMVSVGQLFFNTPARRKFLKTTNTEMGYIADTLSSMAMAYPSVQFRLTHNGKEVKRLSSVTDPLERISQVIGNSMKKDLYPINFSNDIVSISGAIASPRNNRASSRSIFIYVNGRYIRDRMVQHAIFQGYGQRLMKGQFPVAVLFLKVPTHTLDVNVHPTKHEVRFSEQKKLHDSIHLVIEETLNRWENSIKWQVHNDKQSDPVHISGIIRHIYSSH